MTYIASLKTHDIGIRLALGAPHFTILQLNAKAGTNPHRGRHRRRPGGESVLTRLLANQIRGVSSTDPLTLALVVIAVFGAGICACILPAHRATRVDPMVTLRYE
jgi:putative ABC transport system permease protein